MKTFIGGIGCFWDETKYDGIKGILSTECGYCGGDDPNVTYKAVCGGDTGHIEVVKVQYDENILSYEDMVRLFFKLHDSTQKNRQGTYVGIQYRSEIFCLDDDQYLIADGIKRNFNKEVYDDKIVTSISMADNFWIAEEYHQKYVRKKKNMIF